MLLQFSALPLIREKKMLQRRHTHGQQAYKLSLKSMSVSIREMQIKTTRYHLAPVTG